MSNTLVPMRLWQIEKFRQNQLPHKSKGKLVKIKGDSGHAKDNGELINSHQYGTSNVQLPLYFNLLLAFILILVVIIHFFHLILGLSPTSKIQHSSSQKQIPRRKKQQEEIMGFIELNLIWEHFYYQFSKWVNQRFNFSDKNTLANYLFCKYPKLDTTLIWKNTNDFR